MKQLKVGSKVSFFIPNGLGRDGVEYKKVKGIVRMILPTHLVCTTLDDKRGARPRVVESFTLL